MNDHTSGVNGPATFEVHVECVCVRRFVGGVDTLVATCCACLMLRLRVRLLSQCNGRSFPFVFCSFRVLKGVGDV